MPRPVVNFLLPGALLGASVLAAAGEDRAKPAEPDLFNKYTDDNHLYLTRLGHLRRELDRFDKDRRWRDTLVQVLATDYSYVGRCQKSLELFDDRPASAKKDSKPAALERMESRDAGAALLELADTHQVIMINEAHHVPMHRAFTLGLLEGLYRKGFRYFAAETLSKRDDGLQARGYPTFKTGWYTHEPVYADLVRTALRLGYTVVPYEHESATPPSKADDPLAAQNAREDGQAKNLKERILAKDPKAKIVVHAGYGHVSKKPATWDLAGKKGEVRLMAFVFQQLTGIEPLSVDQTLMSEHGKPEREPADYRFAVEKGLVKDRPVVLREADAKGYCVPASVRGTYDVVVFHPRSRFENGRPTWLALGGRRKPHTVKSEARPPAGASYLAQAFLKKEEGNDAVPIDQMEYGTDEPVPTLWLPTGEIRVRIVDEAGKVIHEYETKG
jgi:hypothetical protein